MAQEKIDPIREQIKARALEQDEAARGLKIYRARLESDDGWHFAVARNRPEAKRKLGTQDVGLADAAQIHNIAVKSLMGY